MSVVTSPQPDGYYDYSMTSQSELKVGDAEDADVTLIEMTDQRWAAHNYAYRPVKIAAKHFCCSAIELIHSR